MKTSPWCSRRWSMRLAIGWIHAFGTDPVVEFQARNAFVGFDIARPGGVDDIGRQRRWRDVTVAVPAGLRAGEPVADELLVEAVLDHALLVVVGTPVPRRVGGEDLVGQSQVAVLVDAELELGVGDDDALGQRVVGALDVGLQGALAQLVGPHRADQFDHLVERDVLVVVSQFGLGGRGEQRLRELAGLDQPGRQRDAAHLAGLLVVDQPRAGQVAAGHGLDRHHLEFLRPPGRGRAPPRGCARRRAGRPGGWGPRRSRRRTRSSRSGCGPCRESRCPGCSRRPRSDRWRRTAGARRRFGTAREPCRWPDADSRTERGASGQPIGQHLVP